MKTLIGLIFLLGAMTCSALGQYVIPSYYDQIYQAQDRTDIRRGWQVFQDQDQVRARQLYLQQQQRYYQPTQRKLR